MSITGWGMADDGAVPYACKGNAGGWCDPDDGDREMLHCSASLGKAVVGWRFQKDDDSV